MNTKWLLALAFVVGCSGSSEDSDTADTDATDTDATDTDTIADTDANDTDASDTDAGDTDASDTDTTPETDAFGLVGDATEGGAKYTNNCAGCHGSSGDNGYAPNLKDVVAEDPKADVAEIIKNGQGGMPAFGTSLGDQGIADVVAYMYTTFK